MTLLHRLRAAWHNLRHHAATDRELDAELEGYLQTLIDEKVRQGRDPHAARREALLELGGAEQVKESVREVRTGAWVETLLRDIRYGTRSLRRTPGVTFAAVIALALGIGATAAIYTVVNAVLLRPLNYPGSDQLVVLLHSEQYPVSPANFLDWQRESRSFAAMGAAESWGPNLSGNGAAEKLPALRLTAEIFPVLGNTPLLGRTFRPDEAVTGREHVVVLSYGLWQRRFGGDRSVVGRSIQLDGEPYEVIGVMPRDFQFAPFWATSTQLWAPKTFTPAAAANRGAQSLRIFARLRPGVTIETAQAEMTLISERIARLDPDAGRDVTVRSLQETVVGKVRPAMLVMLGAVALLLLMACANVAHMLLARAATRQREVAVRSAIGATRSRMVRQFITESLLLALFASIVGLLVGWAGTRAIVAYAPATLPRAAAISLDLNAVGVTLLVGLLTGLVFGLAPAWQSAGTDLNRVLREGARGSSEGGGRARARDVLVASQFGLAVMLLIGAGLLTRSFLALQRVDPGFNPEGVMSLVISVGGTREGEPATRATFFQEALGRIRTLPGVRAASAINHIPIAGDMWGQTYWSEGHTELAPGVRQGATWRIVMPGYFDAMQLPLIRGRDITYQDRLGTTDVVIVNQVLAERQWPGEDPIGKRITIEDPAEGAHWLTVIGVAKNAVRQDWAARHSEELYVPFLQDRGFLESPRGRGNYLSFVIRTDGDPAAIVPGVRGAIADIDPAIPISEIASMESVVSRATAGPRFHLFLLGTFAAVALTLAAVGVFGVMSYAVSRRTQEIGIRMALGANPAEVQRAILRRGLLVAMSGTVVGLVAAFALSGALRGLLYGIGPTDLVTFVAVPLLLAVVALLASYLPARRATRIDPLLALRHD